MIGGLVVVGPHQLVRRILLRHHAVTVVVRIDVADGIAEFGGPGVVPVA
ncbi:Uncharacterised protein [Mycobacteroides abscessus subsp. abscessus]|nr:Uncharacterised protein [Mycobacteroides abscessus subsp. abscessus]